MPLDKNFKNQFINYTTHAVIVCILVLSIPLESCSENISFPFSKSSAIQKIEPTEKEDFSEEVQITSIDHSNTSYIYDLYSATTINNLSNNSEKADRNREEFDLFSKKDIGDTRILPREEKENTVKTQKQLEERTFKTRKGGYTIRFYKRSEKWIAKVTDYDKKEYDLPAFLSEEDIKYLIYSVPTTISSIQVILPTTSKEGYVYVGILVGGMKRKEPEKEEEEDSNVPQEPSTNNKSAISSSSTASAPRKRPLSLKLGKKPELKKVQPNTEKEEKEDSNVPQKPNTNNKTSIVISDIITKTRPASTGRLSLSRNRNKNTELNKIKQESQLTQTSPITAPSSTATISNEERRTEEKRKEKADDEKAGGTLGSSIKFPEDLYYGDNDITDFIEIFFKNHSIYKYFQNNNYLLSSSIDTFSPIVDEQDRRAYIVAISPAIDRTGLSRTQNLRTGGTASNTNIDYWLDKSTHPKDTPEKLLEELLDFDLSLERNPYGALLAKIEEVQPNSDRVKFIDKIVEETGEGVEKIIAGFKRKLDEIKQSKHNKDIFDELMPAFLKGDASYAKVLIPYNLTQSHWLTGEICIHREDNSYQVEIFAHDPMGGGKMEDETFNKLQSAIIKRIKECDSKALVTCVNKQSPYQARRQALGDNTSCGIIITEEIIDRITGAIKPTSYPIGVPDLREQHINFVKHYKPKAAFLSRNEPKLAYIKAKERRLTDGDSLQAEEEPITIKQEGTITQVGIGMSEYGSSLSGAFNKKKISATPFISFKLSSQELQADREILYKNALKCREENNVRKALEYAIRAADKGSTEAKRMVSELKKEGENIFQEAEKLLAEGIKEKKEKYFNKKLKELLLNMKMLPIWDINRHK